MSAPSNCITIQPPSGNWLPDCHVVRSSSVTSRDLSDESRILPVYESTIRRPGTVASRLRRARQRHYHTTDCGKLVKTEVSHVGPRRRLQRRHERRDEVWLHSDKSQPSVSLLAASQNSGSIPSQCRDLGIGTVELWEGLGILLLLHETGHFAVKSFFIVNILTSTGVFLRHLTRILTVWVEHGTELCILSNIDIWFPL